LRPAAAALRVAAALSGLALGLCGCGLLPPIPVFEHVNQQVTQGLTAVVAKDGTRAASPEDPRVPRASERPGRDALQGNVFVGLGVSGGGARAANFGAAVMQQLETLGLMQRVTVMSSVSGGGLPTAWYALHGDELTAENPQAWDRLRQAMAFDFRQEWQHSVLAPPNLVATFVSGLNRSDLMIQVFERRLFHGATFGDLGAVGPRRPVVLFNATDITREGIGFAFSEQEFSSRNSRLDTFPIARAVMASGAFPGAFSSVTLRNHPPRRPDGTASERVLYTHLMDGGPADNYGIDKLVQAARSAWQRSAQREDFACLFVVVDAHVVNHSSERAVDRDLRNAPLDYLVDPNVFEAVDTLLVQRRLDSLRRIGLALAGSERERYRRPSRSIFQAQADGGLARDVEPYRRVVDFELPVQDIDESARPPRCRVWHVALNEIRSIRTGVKIDTLGLPEIGDALLRHRAGLWEGITRIKTDYRLGGLPNCSVEQLQALLYRAAELTLREDGDALDQVCDWLGRHAGAAAESQCRAGVQAPRATPLPFTLRSESEALGTEVSCPAVRAGRH
jgi:predicted acylesterase/phospholipase RssA